MVLSAGFVVMLLAMGGCANRHGQDPDHALVVDRRELFAAIGDNFNPGFTFPVYAPLFYTGTAPGFQTFFLDITGLSARRLYYRVPVADMAITHPVPAPAPARLIAGLDPAWPSEQEWRAWGKPELAHAYDDWRIRSTATGAGPAP
jgi:hypothetical protein